jgi:adenylate kinase
MHPITLLFFGAQGSGKGTQVGLLLDYLRTKSATEIIHIDMGAELRALVSAGGLSGSLVHAVIGVGRRLPDFIPTYLQTKKFVEQFTGSEHIIADGLARGADQTRAFDDMMQFYGRSDYHIIHLILSEESSVKRILARGRNDDTEEAIRRRLAWTKTDVMPQLELLRSRGRTIHEIDAEPEVGVVHQSILTALNLS